MALIMMLKVRRKIRDTFHEHRDRFREMYFNGCAYFMVSACVACSFPTLFVYTYAIARLEKKFRGKPGFYEYSEALQNSLCEVVIFYTLPITVLLSAFLMICGLSIFHSVLYSMAATNTPTCSLGIINIMRGVIGK